MAADVEVEVEVEVPQARVAGRGAAARARLVAAPPPPRAAAALTGLVAAAVALGVTELAAGIVPDVPSFVSAIGDAVIDDSPGWFVRFGVDRFGTNDKPSLVIGIVIVSLLIGVGAGLLA